MATTKLTEIQKLKKKEQKILKELLEIRKQIRDLENTKEKNN